MSANVANVLEAKRKKSRPPESFLIPQPIPPKKSEKILIWSVLGFNHASLPSHRWTLLKTIENNRCCLSQKLSQNIIAPDDLGKSSQRWRPSSFGDGINFLLLHRAGVCVCNKKMTPSN